MFDAIAARYDLLNHLLSAGLDRRWRRRAIAALRLSGRETVLDLCTGTGDLALAATEGSATSGRARRVVGIDFSGEMLRIAQRKADARPIYLLRGDATRIPLGDRRVDAVTIGFGIRNVERPLEACREIARVLRPNGILVILEFSLPRSPVLRSFYLSYFRRVLPLIGRAISRHKTAYSYLPESVEAFPSPEEFSQQLRDSGFGTVNAVPLTFGVVYMFVAVKSEGSGRVV
jgi:demethylmenaquinone methyltransferase/2-methoxy-6-polyprenyl-1,4-benzoquinol methylase